MARQPHYGLPWVSTSGKTTGMMFISLTWILRSTNSPSRAICVQQTRLAVTLVYDTSSDGLDHVVEWGAWWGVVRATVGDTRYRTPWIDFSKLEISTTKRIPNQKRYVAEKPSTRRFQHRHSCYGVIEL